MQRPGTIRPASAGAVRPPAGKGGIRPAGTAGGIRPGGAAVRVATPPAGRPPSHVQAQARPAVQPAGIKRPGAVTPAGGAVKKPALPAVTAKDAPKFTVTSQSKSGDIGIQTLVGDYADKGINHGKRFYQKVQKIPGHEDIKVFLYYWDQRDGADNSGWWFGDQVGGTQVWARCGAQTPTPPRVGWKVPWDSPTAKPGLLFVDPYKAPATPAATPASSPAAVKPGVVTPAATAANGASTPAALAARVKKATSQVEVAEKAATAMTTRAKTLLAAATPAAESALKDLQANLQKQQIALGEAQKNLTQDITEARKGGASATSSVTELSKLSPKIRTAQAAIVEQLTKVKAQLAKPAQPSAAQKEQAKKQEEKDTKDFQASLPAVKDLTTAAEDSVQAIASMADPITADPPADGSDDLKKALDEVEASSTDAQNKITEARKQITQKLQGARNYAPETRKTALAEFSALQTRLTEAQKKLMPFRTFKKDFKSRVEAKKALSELMDKLSLAELEVEKAAMMAVAAESGQMAEEEVANCEKAVTTAQTAVNGAVKSIDEKLRSAQGAVKDELTTLKDRGVGLRKKCEGVMTTMRAQRIGINAQNVAKLCTEKITAAEEALAACQDAEMPFLKGIEVLPPDESAKAIGDCESACTKAEAASNQAKALIKGKQVESKKYPKELQEKAAKELVELLSRAEACAKKVADFKKETAERKLNALMAEVLDAIKAAEARVKAHTDVAKVFLDDLEVVTEMDLKDAMEKVGELDKEATNALNEARKQLQIKQKDAKGPEAMAQMNKLQGRVKTVQEELAKHKKAAVHGEKLIKGKEVMAQVAENIQKADGEVEKAEKAAVPVEAGGEGSEELLAELGDAIVSAQNVVKTTTKSVESQMATPVPTLKTALAKLLERSKKCQERLDKVLADQKGTKERALGEAYVREGKKKADAVEACVEKVNEAELPYLKGIEVLPLTEATSTIEASEKAAVDLSNVITEARTYLAAKNLELKAFTDKEKSKPLMEEMTSLTTRVNSASQKLTEFKKDTESRKKTAQLQAAGEKITAAEGEVDKVAEMAVPLGEEEFEKLSEEEAQAAAEKAGAQAKVAQAALDEARNLLAARQKEAKGVASLAETLKSLQARLSEANTKLSKAKKVVATQEHKFVAKRVLAEVNEQIASLEAEVKAAEEAAAPLLEKNGETFLVQASLKTLTAALRDHMKQKSLDIDGLFKEAAAGQATIGGEAFVSWLEKLPEAISHPEVEFTEERRKAVLGLIDTVGDGQVTPEKFKDIFKQTFVCVTGISMTDVLTVSASKTVGKVEPKEVLEAVSEVGTDEATGMERVEVKIISSGKTGFVTLKGNQGTKYLQDWSPFTDFCAALDKEVEERAQNVKKVMSFLNSKSQELAAGGATGPMAEAKAELMKLRPQAATHQTAIQNLKTKVAAGKKDFQKAEAAEKNAHIEAKERREAEAITGPIIKDVEAAEALAKKVEDAAEPLVSKKGEELHAFETPASILKDVETLLPDATAALTKVKSTIQEETKKVAKAVKGPMLEAKKELQKTYAKVESAIKKCNTTLSVTKKACADIAKAGYTKAAVALRAEVQKKSGSAEELFKELAAGSDRISEEALIKCLISVVTDLKPEHAKLVCNKLEAGSIGKRSFLGFVQRYYSVTTAIAITSEFEISKAKTLRKAEPEELIEVLEGPVADEKIGLERVRARSLLDGTEGWISIKGNQGSQFLKEIPKPFYTVAGSEEVPLEPNFKVGDGEAVRALKPGEVMEMLEGPKKETFPPGLRARVKATSDNAAGWVTIRSKQGVVFAEAEGKIYTCVSSVAMTDNEDIKKCEVVKKLAVGELFSVEEGPVEQKESGVTRVKGRTTKDDKVGWITIKGNAGTVYASASNKHYGVVKEVAMQKAMASNSEKIRDLAVGEAVQVIEGPKEEVQQPAVRVKVKATSDGASGWVTAQLPSVKRWSSLYKCQSATPMHSACKAEGAEVLREIAAGEVLDLLEGPVEEAGELRMKAKAKKDSKEGWVTIRDTDGKSKMSC
eukprot:TRINITY_DN193_c0_g1_i5.p1 TRINITY_DN193_c0_g1~~TRINITY_DN193_c0_g1_i5.p1  ORF type:complete len:2073 (-),score=714.85 TRINITY_DN193_c0_g1_i5:36-6125(-)